MNYCRFGCNWWWRRQRQPDNLNSYECRNKIMCKMQDTFLVFFCPHHAVCEHTWVWLVFSCHGETNNCWHGCMKRKIETVGWKKTKPVWDMTVTKLYENVWSDFIWTKKSMRFLWREHCIQIYCLNPFFYRHSKRNTISIDRFFCSRFFSCTDWKQIQLVS